MPTKGLIFFLLLNFTFTTVRCQGTWELLSQSPEIEYFAKRYDDIFFLNDSTGFAGNTDGQILKLNDYGDSIAIVYSGFEKIRAIEFLDDSIGFAGTLEGHSFLQTIDGGLTWNDIGDRIENESIQVCGLSKADESTIYAVGRWAGPAHVFKSSDKGATWTVIDLSHISNGLTDAHFFDKEHGFVVGSSNYDSLGGVILETKNGGLSWKTAYTTGTLEDFIWKIQFVNDSTGYSSIQSFFGSSKRIIKTTNKGKTWNTITVLQNDTTDIVFQGIGFVNDTLGWVGGWGNGLYQTIDGGSNWELIETGSNYNRFFPRSANLVYASGNRLYRYADSLNLNQADSSKMVLSTKFNEHKNKQLVVYPNPIQNQISVQLNLSVRSFVDLKIYDTNGATLKRVARDELAKGSHVLKIEADDLAAGTYVVGLKTSEGYYFRRIVKE